MTKASDSKPIEDLAASLILMTIDSLYFPLEAFLARLIRRSILALLIL